MRIAVLSDIHGNLEALKAVLRDVESFGPDEIWCGGDLGWGGPWASECIARVRDAGWPTVKGNTDVWITGDPQTVVDETEREELRSLASAHHVSEDDAAWLLNLPLGHSGPGSVLLVHGTPHSPFQAPTPDSPAAEFAPYGGKATIVIFGHVHRAFTRRLTDGTVVCNAGSVGLPLDGQHACYLLVDLEGPEWTLRHRRVAVDHVRTMEAARQAGGPVAEHFIRTLREQVL